MKLGLVSYQCENNNVAFNMNQIRRALIEAGNTVDALCFGEAFLQGFDSLCWNYEADKETAIEQNSELMDQLKSWTKEFNVALMFGYVEREDDRLFSSYAVLANGEMIHNFRRISKGWKDFRVTDHHYCEGTKTNDFQLFGKTMNIALCGDLWDFPEKFGTDGLLVWPIYVNYDLEQWQGGMVEDYARQAALVSREAVLINSIDRGEAVNHGASFYFKNGKIRKRLAFDKEDILVVEV